MFRFTVVDKEIVGRILSEIREHVGLSVEEMKTEIFKRESGPYFRNGNCRTPRTVSHYEQVESGREPNRIVYRFVAEQVVRITSAAKAPKGDFLQQKLQSLKAHIPDLRV